MIIAGHVCYKYHYYIEFEIIQFHTQWLKFEIITIYVIRCVQQWVQHTLIGVKVVVNTEFEGTISARVCQNKSPNRESADALYENESGEDEHDGDEDAEDEGDEGEDDDADEAHKADDVGNK